MTDRKTFKSIAAIIFLLPFYLFGVSTTTAAAAALFGSTAVYPIDPSLRGKDLIQLYATLSSGSYSTSASEIGLQTTFGNTSAYATGISNGFIPNIQKLQPATHNTLFIVSYLTTPRAGTPQYIVAAVEQIIDLIYSPLSIPISGFTSNASANSFSFFPIDLGKRAEDIRSIINILLTQKPYKTASSTVSIQTTLLGPFYPSFSSGLIPQVQSISLTSASNETMLIITFLSSSYVTGTVVASIDQIKQIIYFPN